MFADIVARAGLLVDIVALEAGVRLVLAIDAPAHTLGLQKIDDGLGGRANAAEAVVGDAKGAGANRSDIVGLARELTQRP